MTPTETPLVTVFGGSGFIGRYAVRALAKRGWRIRAAVRRPDLAGFLQPMGVVGQIAPVQANIRYPDSVAAAVDGADAVVNLVGILAPTGRQTFTAIQHEGAARIAEAAAAAGATRLVHVSAIGADRNSKSRYARTKALGEEAVLSAFPDAVILRPSIVFGQEDEFFNRFAQMAVTAPVLPLIGGGRTKFQPVFVGDVAEAIARAVEGSAQRATIYELGGPEVASFRALMKKMMAWTDRRRALISIPFWAAKLLALVTKPLPSSLRPITVDQVRLLQTDNVVSEGARAENRTLAGLGIDPPTPMGAIVPNYLSRFNPQGQYAHYRG